MVAEARLKTLPLASADFHEEVLPLQPFLDDPRDHARALDQRTLLFPKLDLLVMRVHENRRPATPHAPFDSLLTGPNTPYVKLARALPRAFRAPVLRAAVKFGVDRKTVHRLHVQNLTRYPARRLGLSRLRHLEPVVHPVRGSDAAHHALLPGASGLPGRIGDRDLPHVPGTALLRL